MAFLVGTLKLLNSCAVKIRNYYGFYNYFLINIKKNSKYG